MQPREYLDRLLKLPTILGGRLRDRGLTWKPVAGSFGMRERSSVAILGAAGVGQALGAGAELAEARRALLGDREHQVRLVLEA